MFNFLKILRSGKKIQGELNSIHATVNDLKYSVNAISSLVDKATFKEAVLPYRLASFDVDLDLVEVATFKRVYLCEVPEYYSPIYPDVHYLSETIAKWKHSHNEYLRKLANQVDFYLNLYRTTNDLSYYNEACSLFYHYQTTSLSAIKSFSNNLIIIYKIYIRLFKTDLRQSYRKVIRFLFKNMDDNSGNEENYFANNNNNFLLLFKHNYHELRTHIIINSKDRRSPIYV